MSICKLFRVPSRVRACMVRAYYNKTDNNSSSSDNIIDLRSDTVTKPCPGMLDAMYRAEVGDDVYKEDPTVNRLEEECAHLFGMESALFVPSGTMGNLLCLMAHINGRGEELMIGSDQHVYCYEQGHFMQLASIPARVVPNQPDGTISITDITNNIRDNSDFHACQTKLICLENTNMRAGGIPLPVTYLRQVGEIAREHKLAVHVDGARIYNAAVSLDCDVSELLKDVDSVSMCLSKGIGAPVGSVIGGTKDFIWRAQRIRKSLGGGLRQSGFLAAAGLYGLERARDVLSRDHRNALLLADGVKRMGCPEVMDVDIESVRSNLLFARTGKGMAGRVVELLKGEGVLCNAFDAQTVRFVTHLNVSSDDVCDALTAIEKVVEMLQVGLNREKVI